MKIIESKLFLTLFAAIFLFGGCSTSNNDTTQSIQSITPSAEPTLEPLQQNTKISRFQPITPENIQEIELIKEIGSGNARNVVLSPDGLMIAVLSVHNILVYDRDTFQKLFSFPFNGSFPATITFSPDNKQIIFTENNSISFLDIKTREKSNSFPLTDIYEYIFEISYTPDMDRLIIEGNKYVANCDGPSPSYALYTLDGVVLFERQGCGFQPTHFHKALNHQQTLFGFTYYDNETPYKIFVIDNESGNVLASFINNYDPDKDELVESITGNPAQFFTMQQFDKWANATDERTQNFQDLQVRCYPDGLPFHAFSLLSIDESYALLKFSSGNSIAITELDVETCKFTEKILYPTNAYQEGIFSPDGKFFFHSNDFKNSLLNLETGLYTYQKILDFRHPNASEYAFNTDGSRLLVGPERRDPYDEGRHYEEMPIHIIDPSTGKILEDIIPGGNDRYTITATLNPDIMMLEYDDRYSLWNIETGEYISSIPTGDYLFDPSRNGIWILKPSLKNDHIVSLYDLYTGKLIKELDILHQSSQTAMSLLEGDSVLNISYTYDHTRICIVQLNIEDGTVLSQECSEEPANEPSSKEQSTEYTDWAFKNYSPQNHILFIDDFGYSVEDQITESDPFIITRDLTFWDKSNGEYLGELDTNYITMKTSFSPNHYFLATWGDDYIIRIYAIPK